MKRVQIVLLVACVVLAVAIGAGQTPGASRMTADAFKGLELREPRSDAQRPAASPTSQSIPINPTCYFVASAVGGLWKSDNRGNTWHSVFDNGGAFNMCCVVVDPKNSDVVWLGTGENSESAQLDVRRRPVQVDRRRRDVHARRPRRHPSTSATS